MLTRDELNILFVDDEENVLKALRRLLVKEPYTAVFASSGREALKIMDHRRIHVVVSDLRMPEMSGLELIQELKNDYPDAIRVVLSATQDIQQTVASINSGEVFRFITKPIEPIIFRKILLDAADFYILKNDREMLVEDLASSNSHLKQALDNIKRVNKENKRLQQKNRQMERRIGEQFLQGDLSRKIKHADIATVNIPSEHLGGDFFDFIANDDGCFDVITADVMGKGVQSALVGAGIKFILLKTLAEEYASSVSKSIKGVDGGESGLEDLLNKVHEKSIAKLIELEMFVTLVYSRIDLKKRLMTYVDCGHTKTIHYRSDIGQCVFLSGEDLPLGMIEEPSFRAKSVELQKGDILLFYSDGVTEAEDADGTFYGLTRLSETVVRSKDYVTEKIVGKVQESVQEHTGQSTFKDDFTCIAVKVS